MTAKFLSGTPLSQIKFEMQLIPGFRPRKSGLAVSRYLYTAADCDCRYCTERAEKKKTPCPACLCLRDRLVAGCVGLNDLRRGHFLLAAHPPLWQAVQPALTDHAVRFQDIRLHGVDVDGYALFHAAKALYCGTEHINLPELADPEVIGDEVFRLIVDAMNSRATLVRVSTFVGRIPRIKVQRGDPDGHIFRSDRLARRPFLRSRDGGHRLRQNPDGERQGVEQSHFL